MDDAQVLALFYGDYGGYEREPNTTSQFELETLEDGDAFYVDGIRHYADGSFAYDPEVKETYVIDENGKRWNEDAFPDYNLRKKENS